MKKIIVALLCIIMCLPLVACGGVAPSPKINSELIFKDNVLELNVGESSNATIMRYTVNGVDGDMTKLRYTSTNTDNVQVDGNKIKGVADGDAFVIVSDGNISARMLVRVTSKVVIDLEKYYVDMATGDEYIVNVKEYTVNGQVGDVAQLTYTSDNTNIVTTSGNVIQAVGNGYTKVNVSDGKGSESIIINVDTDSEIILKNSRMELSVGDKQPVEIESYTVNGKAGDINKLTYISDDETVVKVEDGKLVGVKKGVAHVTVTDGTAINVIAVKVIKYASEEAIKNFQSNAVITLGRTYKDQSNHLVLDNVNSGIEFWFEGTRAEVTVSAKVLGQGAYTPQYSYMTCFIDDDTTGTRFVLDKGDHGKYELCNGLTDGKHKILLVKATEQNLYTAGESSVVMESIYTGTDCKVLVPESTQGRLKIDFYGDSITCGAGNLGLASSGEELQTKNENGAMSYAAITGRTLNAIVSCVSYSGLTVGTTGFSGLPYSMNTIWKKYSTINKKTNYNIDPNTNLVVINLGTNDSRWVNEDGGTQQTERLNGLKENCKTLLNEMLNTYGANTKFIWAYGMMGEDANVANAIKTAISEIANTNVTYLSLGAYANNSGEANHPQVSAHETVATVLVQEINKILGLN